MRGFKCILQCRKRGLYIPCGGAHIRSGSELAQWRCAHRSPNEWERDVSDYIVSDYYVCVHVCVCGKEGVREGVRVSERVCEGVRVRVRERV
jgi:hypothetical protein